MSKPPEPAAKGEKTRVPLEDPERLTAFLRELLPEVSDETLAMLVGLFTRQNMEISRLGAALGELRRGRSGGASERIGKDQLMLFALLAAAGQQPGAGAAAGEGTEGGSAGSAPPLTGPAPEPPKPKGKLLSSLHAHARGSHAEPGCRGNRDRMNTIGIVAHSAEGGALCFLTACREGAEHLGPHMHPPIVVSAIPMGRSMPGWESGDHAAVGVHLAAGVRQVADAGADFYICPDNTAHLVLEAIAPTLALPGLHIAEVVCHEIADHGWKRVGLLGTKWTMNGPVYARALGELGIERLTPDTATQEKIQAAIFDELCQGVFPETTTQMFVSAIEALEAQGAECVILGCTEIPLIITESNSALPILDSTRLLARHAVRRALDERPIPPGGGWLAVKG